MIDQFLNSLILDKLLSLASEYYLWYILGTLLVLKETWIRYIAMTRLHMMREAGLLDVKRNSFAWWLAMYHLGEFLILDFTLMILLSIPLLDVPRVWKGELLTTGFLSRHYKERPAFDVFKIWQPLHNLDMWYSMHVRKPFATWAGKVLLDDADPSGKHIKES